MIDFESATISARFFEAVDTLKRDGKLSGITEFCNRYELNRRNVMKQKIEPTRQIFKVSWLVYLFRDYGVSGDWLLSGMGDFYRISDQKRAKNVQAIEELLQTLR